MRSRYQTGDPIDPAVIAFYARGLTAAAVEIVAAQKARTPEHCTARMAAAAEAQAAEVRRWQQKAELRQAEALGKVVEGVYRGPVAQIAAAGD